MDDAGPPIGGVGSLETNKENGLLKDERRHLQRDAARRSRCADPGRIARDASVVSARCSTNCRWPTGDMLRSVDAGARLADDARPIARRPRRVSQRASITSRVGFNGDISPETTMHPARAPDERTTATSFNAAATAASQARTALQYGALAPALGAHHAARPGHVAGTLSRRCNTRCSNASVSNGIDYRDDAARRSHARRRRPRQRSSRPTSSARPRASSPRRRVPNQRSSTLPTRTGCTPGRSRSSWVWSIWITPTTRKGTAQSTGTLAVDLKVGLYQRGEPECRRDAHLFSLVRKGIDVADARTRTSQAVPLLALRRSGADRRVARAAALGSRRRTVPLDAAACLETISPNAADHRSRRSARRHLSRSPRRSAKAPIFASLNAAEGSDPRAHARSAAERRAAPPRRLRAACSAEYVVPSTRRESLRGASSRIWSIAASGVEIAVGRRLPALRETVAAKLTRDAANNALKVALASAVVDHIPVVGVVFGAFASAGDMVAITGIQIDADAAHRGRIRPRSRRAAHLAALARHRRRLRLAHAGARTRRASFRSPASRSKARSPTPARSSSAKA